MTADAAPQVSGYEDPRITRSRAIIMAAATDAFLANGYPATSVDDVAGSAGVSKRTVYNVFGDKEQLFRAILSEAIETAESFSNKLVTVIDTTDAEAELRQLAHDLAQVVLGGRVIPLRRLLIAEVRRFPELAAEYYDRAPGRVMDSVAEVLRRFDERGLLRIDDANRAAEHFAFLTIGASLDRSMFDIDAGTGAGTLGDERAESGVQAFLRAYAA